MNASDVMTFAEPLMLRPMALSICIGLLLALGYFLLRPWPPEKSRMAIFGMAAILTLLAVGGLLRQRTVEIDLTNRQLTTSESFLGFGSEHRRQVDEARRIVVSPAGDRPERAGPRKTVPLPLNHFDLSIQFPDESIYLSTVNGVLKAENAARGLSIRLDLPAIRSGYVVRAGTGVEAPRQFELEDGRVGAQFDLEPVVQVTASPEANSVIRDVPQADRNP